MVSLLAINDSSAYIKDIAVGLNFAIHILELGHRMGECAITNGFSLRVDGRRYSSRRPRADREDFLHNPSLRLKKKGVKKRA